MSNKKTKFTVIVEESLSLRIEIFGFEFSKTEEEQCITCDQRDVCPAASPLIGHFYVASTNKLDKILADIKEKLLPHPRAIGIFVRDNTNQTISIYKKIGTLEDATAVAIKLFKLYAQSGEISFDEKTETISDKREASSNLN